MATWVLNDENKANVYGFRVKNSGINLDRFRENPVMLAMHREWDLDAIIGRWTNIRVEGSQLLADDEFDMEDDKAKSIAGKAQRGFLKGVSMGFLFIQDQMEKALDGVFELVESELYEASLVTIPGNAASVRLYAAPGQLMDEKEIKLQLSAAMNPEPQKQAPKPNIDNMEKFTLSGAALAVLLTAGLSKQDDPSEVNNAIAQLGTSLKKAKDDLEEARGTIQTMKDAQLSAAKKNAEALVDAAVVSGKLTADKKEQFVKLALSDPDLAKNILDNMPGKANLSGQVSGTPAGGADQPKNLDEFEKLPVAKQLAFKEEHPEDYRALFSVRD